MLYQLSYSHHQESGNLLGDRVGVNDRFAIEPR